MDTASANNSIEGSAVSAAPGRFELEASAGDTLLIRLSGAWTLASRPPAAELVSEVRSRSAARPAPRRIVFETGSLAGWDSALLTPLASLHRLATDAGMQLDPDGLPEGARRLLKLAFAVPERPGVRRKDAGVNFLQSVGEATLAAIAGATNALSFIGEAAIAVARLTIGRARFRRVDFMQILQECGAQALPIVSLISVLVGLILAFVGAVQLQMFGAEIFVADLVGIGMAREMGAMMTGIIMAGRTGAAFAAQLGTMEVNEEIDALKTLGIEPMEFLVLPRMLALMLMMPLLCVYSNVMGILGGAVVGLGMLNLAPVEYYQQTRAALGLDDFAIGLAKAAVFGVVVALCGCLRGMQCGRSASAVGLATTSAVVTSIVFIVVTDSVITVICSVLGI